MKEYDKEKLNEYAKELFALCLEKGLDFKYCDLSENIEVWVSKGDLKRIGDSYISENLFNNSWGNTTPIWELIEKVKSL